MSQSSDPPPNAARISVDQKVCFTYNKFFSGFLRLVKDAADPNIRRSVKQRYTVINKQSPEYIQYAVEFFASTVPAVASRSPEELAADEAFRGASLIEGVSLGSALDAVSGDPEAKMTFWNHVYILGAMVAVFGHLDGGAVDESKIDALYTTVAEAVLWLQENPGPAAGVDDIVDDDIRGLLHKISYPTPAPAPAAAAAAPAAAAADLLNMLGDSKIANIAKEIAADIDTSQLGDIQSPEDIMKLLDFSSSNNAMADIVKRVSESIQGKMSSGELNQDDLFGEAMTMMGMLNAGGGGGGLGDILNNPLIGSLMKSMKKGHAPQTKPRAASVTRDRLRAKLNARREGGEAVPDDGK